MNPGVYARAGKRVLDLIMSTLIILLCLVPGAILALAIILESKGPVFYSQERVGRFGRPFQMLKFRSMVVGAEKMGAGALVEKRDPRVTRVGRLLRATSLDELPQVWNVFRGKMSLIGPRPGLQYQVEQYDDRQRRRLLVPPGITGWAQVNGRNSIPWDERIRFDLEYVDGLTFAMDLRILLRTAGVLFKRQDQIAGADYWKEKRQQTEEPTENRRTAS